MYKVMAALLHILVASAFWGLALVARADAQSSRLAIGDYARIEWRGDAALLIGSKDGKAYVRAMNDGPNAMRLFIDAARLSNVETGERSSFSKTLKLAPFEIGAPVYLTAAAATPAWVTGWSATVTDTVMPEPEDRDAAPFYRPPPKYPADCMQIANASETIMLIFDIDEKGGVENIIVFRVSQGCLALAAQQAAQRWVYAPKIVDGKPVARKGVETQIRFQLADD